MMTAEQIRFIREEINRQMNIILNAAVGDNTSQTETIDNLFPGMPGIDKRPVMHPFGFVSRATQGTISVTAKVGEHTGNRMVLGHRDKARPDVQSGEVMLYNAFGDKIYVSQGEIVSTTPHLVEEADNIQMGSKNAKEPFVLGLIFKKFASDVLQLIIEHTHECSVPGGESSPPINELEFEQQKQDPIENSAILSDKIFGEKG